MPRSQLRWFAVLVVVGALGAFGRALFAQQPAPRDSTPTDSSHRDSTSRLRRWLNFDHIGIAVGPSVTVRRSGWMSSDEVTPGIAGGFFRGAGFGDREHAGLVPAFRFDIFPRRLSVVDTTSAAAGTANAPGTIRMRSLMAGLGWSQPLGQSTSAVISGVLGRAFNSISSATTSTRGAPFDVATSPASIGDAAEWEVSGRVWHRLRPRIVILTGISYDRMRPTLAFADGAQRTSNFDTVRADLGVAFTIYKR